MTPAFEFLMRLEADVGEPSSMGVGPLGERRIVPINGGSFAGPRIRGDILPGGNDWQIVRADGVIELDARYALREQRGGSIRVVSQGYRHGAPEVLAAIARGEDVEPARYYFRTAMRFETGAPGLAWLNGMLAVACAERKARRVLIDAYLIL